MSLVRLEQPVKHIALVCMEDREGKNAFSEAFIKAILEQFQVIKDNPEFKVVIVKGYENYFSSGGNKEFLLKLAAQDSNFNQSAFFRILLDCELPTIAAMEGHAMGGGLTFGCYADWMVLSLERFYAANFMHFGFTPGVGATMMIPKRFGQTIGTEMLYTGKNYQGRELQARNTELLFVPSVEVMSKAMEHAELLAKKPLVSLKQLKKHLTQTTKNKLELVIQQELAMHEMTFGLPEVRDNIEKMIRE